MIVGIVHFNDTMYGFQEDLAMNQKSTIDHPDHEEIEAEILLEMTPLTALAPSAPSACLCGCTSTGTM